MAIDCAQRAAFSFSARRNCSAEPRLVLSLFLAASAFFLAIGLAFALLGAWPVLPFTGAEVMALGAALLVARRHAGDRERITLTQSSLRVETREAGRRRCREFNPCWVQLVEEPRSGRLLLRSHGRELEIGRHLDAARRHRLAGELRRRLAAFRR